MASVVVVGWVGGRCLRLGDHHSGHAREIAQMDVPERKRELQRKREQRKRSSKSAIRSKPAHDGSPHPTELAKIKSGETAEGTADIAAAKAINPKITEEFDQPDLR